MAILHTDIESLAQRLTAGLNAELEAEIKKLLQEQADQIIKDAAKQVVESISAYIKTYYDYKDDKVQVVVHINRGENGTQF